EHAGPAEMNDQRAVGERALARVPRANVADTARDPDRLMIAADFTCHLLFEGTEVTEEIRPAELVDERRRADRAFEHDLQRRGDTVGLAVVNLPGLRHVGNLEMRYRESGQPCLRPGADPGCAFVADLAAGARRSAWKRRDRRRMIVRLDFHQNMRDLRPRRV